MDDITRRPVGCNIQDRTDYLLAELRSASLRARLWQSDIDAVGKALKVGLVTPDQALEMLQDCDCLSLVTPGLPPTPAEEAWHSPSWAAATASYHAERKGRAA
jgi:hypothetical protein